MEGPSQSACQLARNSIRQRRVRRGLTHSSCEPVCSVDSPIAFPVVKFHGTKAGRAASEAQAGWVTGNVPPASHDWPSVTRENTFLAPRECGGLALFAAKTNEPTPLCGGIVVAWPESVRDLARIRA